MGAPFGNRDILLTFANISEAYTKCTLVRSRFISALFRFVFKFSIGCVIYCVIFLQCRIVKFAVNMLLFDVNDRSPAVRTKLESLTKLLD